MSASSTPTAESLIPVLRYRDIAASAGWLCSAFGFQQKSLVATEDGTAIYAELAHGRGTLMLVPVGQSELDQHMRQPDEIEGAETQTCYVTINDADLHYHRAVDQGAEIILPLSSDGSGQRGYTCRDCEGHIWSFGTYAPAHHRIADAEVMPSYLGRELLAPPTNTQPKRGFKIAAIAIPATLMALAAVALMIPGNPVSDKGSELWSHYSAAAPEAAQEDNSSNETGVSNVAAAAVPAQEPVKSRLFGAAGGSRQFEDTILKLRQEITETKMALNKARDGAAGMSRDLSAEYTRRTAAEKLAAQHKAAFDQAEASQAEQAQTLARLETELHKERSARGAAVQASEQLKQQLSAEQSKSAKAEDTKADSQAAKIETPQAVEQPSTPPSAALAPDATPPTQPAETTAATAPEPAPVPVTADVPSASAAADPSITTTESPEETGSVEPTSSSLPKPSLLKSASKGKKFSRDKAERNAKPEKSSKPDKSDKPSKPIKQASRSVPKPQKSAPRRKASGAEKAWPYSEW